MTVAGGTLNLISHSIGNSITLITTGGELENITTIQTTGGVTMNTSGNTLILDGTNAWTGGTTISTGTVQVGQASDTAALTSPLGTSAECSIRCNHSQLCQQPGNDRQQYDQRRRDCQRKRARAPPP